MNSELIDKKNGCGIKKCPKCKAIKVSRTIENDVYVYFCSHCASAFKGGDIDKIEEFSVDLRCKV